MAALDDVSGRKPVPERKLQATPAPNTAPAPIISVSNAQPASNTASTPSTEPERTSALRIAAFLFRAAFIFILIALVIRVSQPQSETIWSAYETPGDLIRLWLGIGACLWLVWQLFSGGPKDAYGYRTWLYLGLTVVPFSLLCLIAIW